MPWAYGADSGGGATHAHPWGGAGQNRPPTSSKTAKTAHPPLGITTDVTPLKIVGLNNYS